MMARNSTARQIAREQIDFMRSAGMKVKDVASAIGMRRTVDAWRDVEPAISAAWKRLRINADGTKYIPHGERR